ncbi:uncharacterized protein LOC142354370 [Convolutriloba macropyga]|uniref:uncharacterized protein LOC142354370 n=1 Tax=Convolutriloba macropyga TaxID=536237 RepID=UPI003F51FBDF
MNSFPVELKRLIENPQIVKTGVNVRGDIYRLQRQLNLSNKGSDVIDLGEMANKVLKCNQTWSLDRLCVHLSNRQLPKTESIRCSQWSEFNLSSDQIKYAALDAYVSWKLYCDLANYSKT